MSGSTLEKKIEKKYEIITVVFAIRTVMGRDQHTHTYR